MKDKRSIFFLAVGAALAATAMRTHSDLGGLLPEPAMWILLAVGSLSMGFSSTGSHTRIRFAGRGLVLAGVALACLTSSPAVFSACVLAVAAGALQYAGRAAWSARLVTASLGLLVVALASAVVDRVSLMPVPTEPFAASVSFVMDLLGADVACRDDRVVFAGARGYRSMIATPNAMGWPVLLPTIAVLWVFALCTRKIRLWVASLGLLAIAWVASGLRFASSAVTAMAADGFTPFDNEDFPTLTFFDWNVIMTLDLLVVVLVSLATASLVKRLARSAGPPIRVRAPVWARFGAVGALAVIAASPATLDCFGEVKRGRVAVDEGHSQWESTDLELGESHYGIESGYNFRALVDWLEKGYGPVRRIYDPLTARSLEDVDVLVIKTPTRAFSPTERATLMQFVESGGGLFLIGDHTNVFGTSEILNEITAEFGFHFVYDCAFDQSQTFEQLWRRPSSLAGQPILRRVPKIRFEVGCTIEVQSPGVRPMIVGRGMKTLPIDYSRSNFYPSVVDSSEMKYGQFCNLVTTYRGAGRVVALSDSTFLSTFSVCLPGRRELVEGAVDWLNRRDVGSGLRDSIMRLALPVLCIALFLLRGATLQFALLAVLVGLTVFSGLVRAAERYGYDSRPAIEEKDGVPEILFVRSKDEQKVFWPVENFVRDHEKSFNIFYQWVLRTAQFPRIVESVEQAVSFDRPIVFIEPGSDVLDQVDRLRDYVARGNALVLIEQSANPVVEALATEAGLKLNPLDESDKFTRLRCAFGPLKLGAADKTWRKIQGGAPLLVAEDLNETSGAVVGAVAKLGKGVLVVMTCGSLFNNASYGFRYNMQPDRTRRTVFQFQFALFKAIRDRARIPQRGTP
ncbi:MAG: DUF4350 domain-containing protein [Planctomycetota bacterium]